MEIQIPLFFIHLSKLTLLEKSCELFGTVFMPERVHEETVKKGKEEGYEDAVLIGEIVEKDLIEIRKVHDEELIERANRFNIQAGEAEAVALYWQEEADILATDDDNVRGKRVILELNLIGTPAIILKLLESGIVSGRKFRESLDSLREIGWFSNIVIDRALERGERHG